MENSTYITKGGKKLRTGYTTGSCAAAAAKAVVKMLFNREVVDQVEIDTPKGWRLKLDVNEPKIVDSSASCYVIKDAGDDPDITDGIHLYARAYPSRNLEIVLKGGKGIGKVTKPGLSVDVGQPAINPVPRALIEKEVREVLPKDAGVVIEFSIPNGEDLAKKTFNPKLGIIDGLSIIGTTGIVNPMSEDAIMDTIALELQYKKEAGAKTILIVPGNYGESFSKSWLNVHDKHIVKISNYLGFALEKCSELGFKQVILAGHVGKLVKVAGGIFYTHSRVSDTRMEVLAANLGVLGMSNEGIREIMNCRTTEEAILVIDRYGFSQVYQLLAEKCADRCEAYVHGAIEIGVVLFSMKSFLAESDKVSLLSRRLTCE